MRKPELLEVNEKRFEYLDHMNPALSKNKRVTGFVSIEKFQDREKYIFNNAISNTI